MIADINAFTGIPIPQTYTSMRTIARRYRVVHTCKSHVAHETCIINDDVPTTITQ